MQSAVSFDYFYGGESEQFSYYRIPKLLVTGAQFKFLSTDAKLLYGLMLDRMGLSLKNQWYDAVGRVFIYYPLEEIMEALNCGHNKAVRLLAELDKSSGIGLIERVKQGQGKPAIIYVKRFTSKKLPVICPADDFRLPETGSPDFPKSEVKTSHNQKSRLPESGSADFPKQEAFIYSKNQSDNSYLYPSIHQSEEPIDTMDRNRCRTLVKENIGYMLVKLNDVLDYASTNKCAIGAFNTPNLESIIAVLDAAEKLNVPVIISHAELHEEVAPLHIIGPVMVLAAKNAKVPVCVHLDHCETLSYMVHALELGFTGVMYDGSLLSYEENVANTNLAVAIAKRYGANVEAEIGQMPARETEKESANGAVYTEPSLALNFVCATGIDALAPSFGTAHGIYKSKPNLDFKRVRNISDLAHVPLVMHGGSGLSEEDYKCAINSGIRKINYYSYMAKAGVDAVQKALQESSINRYHTLAHIAQTAMQADVERVMRIFYGLTES